VQRAVLGAQADAREVDARMLLAAAVTTLCSAASRPGVGGVLPWGTACSIPNVEAASRSRLPGTALAEHACGCHGRCRVLATYGEAYAEKPCTHWSPVELGLAEGGGAGQRFTSAWPMQRR
jgi:hypothetical protein